MEEHFDSDRNIIGQAIRLKSVPYTVIGVLSPRAPTPERADLWTSLRPDTSGRGGGVITIRSSGWTLAPAGSRSTRSWADCNP